MDEALQIQLAALESRSGLRRSRGLQADRRLVLGAVAPALRPFRETKRERYGDEITRSSRGVLNELATSQNACPKHRNSRPALATGSASFMRVRPAGTKSQTLVHYHLVTKPLRLRLVLLAVGVTLLIFATMPPSP